MKKLLISILNLLLVALCFYTVIEGIKLGPIEILGYKGITIKNDELNKKIDEANRIAEEDYIKACNEVKRNTENLQNEKKNFEDITEISEGGDIQAANQLEKYKYDTLMIKLGRHATTQGADVKINIEVGNTQGVYNLNFTATGSYVSIMDFISSIENDSTLGFKIEKFSMRPVSSGETLEATFICKTIAIEEITGGAGQQIYNEDITNSSPTDENTTDENTADETTTEGTTTDETTTNRNNTEETPGFEIQR